MEVQVRPPEALSKCLWGSLIKIQHAEWPQELQMLTNYSRKIDLILVEKELF